MPPSVLIVDDHAGFRTRARRALELDGFTVVGEAEDLVTGLAAADRLQPGLILLDVHLPDGCGLDAAPRFLREIPGARVLLISTYDAIDVEPAPGQVGSLGFLPKSELSGAAIARLLAG